MQGRERSIFCVATVFSSKNWGQKRAHLRNALSVIRSIGYGQHRGKVKGANTASKLRSFMLKKQGNECKSVTQAMTRVMAFTCDKPVLSHPPVVEFRLTRARILKSSPEHGLLPASTTASLPACRSQTELKRNAFSNLRFAFAGLASNCAHHKNSPARHRTTCWSRVGFSVHGRKNSLSSQAPFLPINEATISLFSSLSSSRD